MNITYHIVEFVISNINFVIETGGLSVGQSNSSNKYQYYATLLVTR